MSTRPMRLPRYLRNLAENGDFELTLAQGDAFRRHDIIQATIKGLREEIVQFDLRGHYASLLVSLDEARMSLEDIVRVVMEGK